MEAGSSFARSLENDLFVLRKSEKSLHSDTTNTANALAHLSLTRRSSEEIIVPEESPVDIENTYNATGDSFEIDIIKTPKAASLASYSLPRFSNQTLTPVKTRRLSTSSFKEVTMLRKEKRRARKELRKTASEPLISCPSAVALLPHYSISSGCKVISPDVLHDLLQGKFKNITKIFIIDCRYEYEFKGGCIRGAINVPFNHRETVNNLFFNSVKEDSLSTAIIFHCEFSRKRSPPVASLMRDIDRAKNMTTVTSNNEGNLYYPHVYLLEGGYKSFFEKYPDDCFPRGYVSMEDEEFAQELRIDVSRSHRQKVRTLERSQSFDLPHSLCLDDED